MDETEEIERRLREANVPREIAAWCAQRLGHGDSTELLQLMLLRALWARIIPAGGSAPLAITGWAELAARGVPFVDGSAAKRLLDAGANAEDLDAIISSAQMVTMHQTLAVLDEGGAEGLRATLGADLGQGLGWAVVAQDPSHTPAQSLGGLSSTFEQLDPRRANDTPSE